MTSRAAMAPAQYLTSPVMRHTQSESCLHARRQTGSTSLALPELKACSSAAPRREGDLNASFRRSGRRSRTTLPPLVEMGRGVVRQLTPPQDRLRPAKRSRSSTTIGTAERKGVHRVLADLDNSTNPKLGLESALPTLSSASSTGALPSRHDRGGHGLDSEVEQVLATALALNDDKVVAQSAAQDQSSFGSNDMEAHLQELLDLPEVHRVKDRRARISANCVDKENKINRKGTGFVHIEASSEKAKGRRARIIDAHGDNENKLHRKGTGFIDLRDASQKHRVRISDNHSDNENRILRKGTGFVHLSSLPKEAPGVSFPDISGGNANGIQRKGTGFIVLNHVPPRVRIADNHGDNENGIQRKGTGFVNLTDCKGDFDDHLSSPTSCGTDATDPNSLLETASDTELPSEHQCVERYQDQVSVVDVF